MLVPMTPNDQRLGVRACRAVEHPCWNLQPTICLRSIQRAAENDIISLVDRSVNANTAAKPRMISIKNLANSGPVGRSQTSLYNNEDHTRSSNGKRRPSSRLPATRAGTWRCATPKAPRQLPSLPPPNRANLTAGANSGLDKTWGQCHLYSPAIEGTRRSPRYDYLSDIFAMLKAYAAFLRSSILNQRRKTKQPCDDASVQNAAQKPEARGSSR
jgi:hypothetical protein